ncbi:MAG: fumarylacetoacetate hydrolase family protein, partial [Myxococcota bacterium]
RASAVWHPTLGHIWCKVDGDLRQDAELGEMIWTVSEIIAFASRVVTLAPGDLFLTGTPAGVGPLAHGAKVRAGVTGLAELALEIV